MLKKLKAVVTAGVLGTCAGAVLGLWIWTLSAILRGAGPRLPLGGVALDLGVTGGLVGSLFAIGLILYTRIRGGADRRVATILGAGAGVLALPLAVLGRDLPVSHWGFFNWAIALLIGGYFGARAGGFVWSIAGVGHEAGERSAPDHSLIRGPDVHDEASVRADPARDRHEMPRYELD